MLKKFYSFNMFGILALALVMGACSSSKQNEEGEEVEFSTEDETAISPGDSLEAGPNAGVPISELSAINFDFDSFSLNSDAKSKLSANADWLKENSDKLITIEGHCDERGTSEYNLALGERRAQAVKDYLVYQLGISESQLATISYGEERPSVYGSSESAWAKNRRAEFVNR